MECESKKGTNYWCFIYGQEWVLKGHYSRPAYQKGWTCVMFYVFLWDTTYIQCLSKAPFCVCSNKLCVPWGPHFLCPLSYRRDTQCRTQKVFPYLFEGRKRLSIRVEGEEGECSCCLGFYRNLYISKSIPFGGFQEDHVPWFGIEIGGSWDQYYFSSSFFESVINLYGCQAQRSRLFF